MKENIKLFNTFINVEYNEGFVLQMLTINKKPICSVFKFSLILVARRPPAGPCRDLTSLLVCPVFCCWATWAEKEKAVVFVVICNNTTLLFSVLEMKKEQLSTDRSVCNDTRFSCCHKCVPHLASLYTAAYRLNVSCTDSLSCTRIMSVMDPLVSPRWYISKTCFTGSSSSHMKLTCCT